MILLTNIIAFIFALGVIIFVHEAGHLLVAKAFDVRVLTFSLGFGKRLFGVRRGETDYRVSAVPLGGYVRLAGEEMEDEASDDPRDFQNKPRWQRILVYIAGPAMNVVLSILIIAVLFMLGTSVASVTGAVDPVVRLVEDGGAGAAAGVEPGDRLVRYGNETIDTWQDFAVAVSVAPGETKPLVLERDGERIETTLTPAEVEPYGYGDAGLFPVLSPQITEVMEGRPGAAAGFEAGDEVLAVDGRAVAGVNDFIRYLQGHPEQEVRVTVRRGTEERVLTVVPEDVGGGVGQIGVGVGVWVRYGPLEAVVESARFNWDLTVRTLDILGKIVTGEVKAQRAVSGPIDIASLSGQAARSGPGALFYLMAVISISIAIFNLLPIPLLDGGQITVLLVETVLGRDLPFAVKNVVQWVGLILIFALMGAVILLDIFKRVGG